ncbi:uncharacterized protein LOC122499787 [Leptopilina heterotoma]|uniref:uncharacterized protein LOC122499787 n=1 Tax=Leptopilina heterotoma TaxID=63436 RepID=UPI001CA7D843|nr:uncharacterized protein LOC122499787 [Leptopilina heterotoma]
MQKDEQFKEAYVNFMDEYLQLGHMRPLTAREIKDPVGMSNYIPHQGIWQRADNAMKFRVVFDASRKTTSGRSLNDVLHSGPKLQNSLAAVISRWRRHKVAYCADIKMMVRQILVRQSDTHLQRVIWSPDQDQSPKHFALLTVTYGETCAPYLALRTLQQLCKDEGGAFPEAVKSIMQDLYVSTS